jgi:hypothetical protein
MGDFYGTATTSPPARLVSDCSSSTAMSSDTGRTPPSPESTWNTRPGSRDRGLSDVSNHRPLLELLEAELPLDPAGPTVGMLAGGKSGSKPGVANHCESLFRKNRKNKASTI